MSRTTCTVTIDSGNAALADNPQAETARILRAVADYVSHGYQAGDCMDANGNEVGRWGFDHEADEPEDDETERLWTNEPNEEE